MGTSVKDRIGLEFLCEVGANPVDLAKWTARAGGRHISILPQQFDYNPLGYPHWSLLGDAALRRELKIVLDDLGVSIGLGEGLAVMPNRSVTDFAPVIDLFCDLGVTRVNGVSMDPDPQRTEDGLALFAEMTQAAGMDLVFEFAPILSVKTLDDVLGVIRAIGRPHVKILLDIMHFVRAGHRPEALDAIDCNLIGYVQICDAPLTGAADYTVEALSERMLPGAGEMPVAEILKRVPEEVIVSAEIPQLSLAQSGVPVQDRLQAITQATERLLMAL